MQKYFNNVVDQQGRAINNAIVTVTTLAGAAATLYSDNGVTLITGNVVTTNALGYFSFYAPDGRYSVAISGNGIANVTVSDILLEDPADGSAALAAPGGAALVGFLQSGTGAVARTVQDKGRESVTLEDFGAVGDGVTNDAAAITAAMAAGGAVRGDPKKVYRCASGITIPGGSTLYAHGFAPSNPPYGCKLLFDLSVATCVTLGGSSGGNKSAGLRGINVLRAAGTPPAGSVGVLNQNTYNAVLEDVNSVGHAIAYNFKSDGTSAGISGSGMRLFSGSITDAHMVFDSWAEARISQSRFGMNGTDTNSTAYIRVTGGSTTNAASGPNTLLFDQCQFNLGNSKQATSAVEFSNMLAGSIADALEFKFSGCHFGTFLTFLKTDSTVTKITYLGIANSRMGSNVQFFTLDAATKLIAFSMTGSQNGGPITINNGMLIDGVSLSNNNFEGLVSFTGVGNSIVNSKGNTYRSGLTLDGNFLSLSMDDAMTGGAYSDTSTGVKKINIPGVSQLTSWTPALSFAGGSVGITYTLQSGVFEIIGDEVVAQFTIILSSKGSSTGNAFIGGLPYGVASNATASAYGCGGIINYMANVTGMTGPATTRLPSGTVADLYQSSSTGYARVTDANLTNTTTIAGTIRYFK